MDMLLDILSEYYPKVLGNFILEYYYNGRENIYNMCKQGVIALFDINKLDKYQLNSGLDGSCLGGYMGIAKLMIKKGANYFNWGLWNACEGGHIEIVKLIIEKEASYFNIGLQCACRNGHMEIVKLMIEKGATRCDNCNNTKHPELLP